MRMRTLHAERASAMDAERAPTCVCVECGTERPRIATREPARCKPCRLRYDNRRAHVRRMARRAQRGLPQQVTARPVARAHALVRLALVPSLTTGAEELRLVSVLARPHVLCHALGLRLVRCHVWGEREPRDIAIERLTNGGPR